MTMESTHILEIGKNTVKIKYTQYFKSSSIKKLFILMKAFININDKSEYYLKGVFKESSHLLVLSTTYSECYTNFPNPIDTHGKYSKDYTTAKELFNNYIKEIVENYVNPLLKSKKTLTGRSL